MISNLRLLIKCVGVVQFVGGDTATGVVLGANSDTGKNSLESPELQLEEPPTPQWWPQPDDDADVGKMTVAPVPRRLRKLLPNGGSETLDSLLGNYHTSTLSLGNVMSTQVKKRDLLIIAFELLRQINNFVSAELFNRVAYPDIGNESCSLNTNEILIIQEEAEGKPMAIQLPEKLKQCDDGPALTSRVTRDILEKLYFVTYTDMSVGLNWKWLAKFNESVFRMADWRCSYSVSGYSLQLSIPALLYGNVGRHGTSRLSSLFNLPFRNQPNCAPLWQNASEALAHLMTPPV